MVRLLGVIGSVCLVLSSLGATCRPESNVVFTPGERLYVYPGRYRPDLEFLDQKYRAVCACLRMDDDCVKSFPVVVITDDVCFACRGAGTETGFCAGMNVLDLQLFIYKIYITENASAFCHELVQVLLRSNQAPEIRTCGDAIDRAMNDAYQAVYGKWPEKCQAYEDSL